MTKKNKNGNNYTFLKYIVTVFLFASLFACATETKSDENDTLTLIRIAEDITQLENDEFDFLTTLKEEIANVNSEDKQSALLKRIFRFSFDNRCLVFIQTDSDFLFYNALPLEEDKYSNLLLLYSKDGKKWKLDTAYTTYPDFEQIAFSAYFLASAQRCVEGRCEWYNAIITINKENELVNVFDFENFNVEMYLDFILPDDRELVSRRIGEEIIRETEIVEYSWTGKTLQNIHIKETTGILQAIENDSLIIKTDSSFRVVAVQEP